MNITLVNASASAQLGASTVTDAKSLGGVARFGIENMVMLIVVAKAVLHIAGCGHRSSRHGQFGDQCLGLAWMGDT
jgi:hypothetical protein